ncbi:MAG: enoyl-CoA hydratase/isomerase family protein [Lewinellaceae bacterium]|nr:enoyl-CoA hydratase/isomerase family protein [Lewinellaceae bacterium]
MYKRIKNVAVLGSGVMGSGIACHLANIGLDVLLLDILPNLDENTPSHLRNSVASTALTNAIKSKPDPLYKSGFASRIKVGNLTDDISKISTCDWIIEVVVEKLEIKKKIFESVDTYRSEGSLVTSNTSGIPIHSLAKGRSDDFKKNFCGTHFFNPARYMALFEIIPHAGTSEDVIAHWMHYGEVFLGKKSVLCKDTPAFIANRIGFYSGNKVSELTQHYHLSIEAVDKLTGDTIGWPNTGSFRLLDLVGLDVSVKVTEGVIKNAPHDEYVQKIKDRTTPKFTQFLLDNKWLGDKTGQGFYKKTEEKDANGKRVILALDLDTLEYRPMEKPMLPAVGISKKVEIMSKRLQDIIELEDSSGKFIRDLIIGIIAYSANRIPEISDQIYSIDDAMKAGYAWGYGPFEYWDLIGFHKVRNLASELGESIPSWIDEMDAAGFSTFYKRENGKKYYYDRINKTYQLMPGSDESLHLDNYRNQSPVYKNSECVLHDIGDGVLCLEFTSKANAIGEGIGQGVIEAIQIAESSDWKGLVIGNNAKNFTVGANLMGVAMVAGMGDFDKLEKMVDGFQQVNMTMRYSKIPVIVATQGYVFGGGCEMLMHADGAICHAESYIGLPEVGVGLIPGGGGTKEFALRASDAFFEGDVQIPTLIEKLKTIATATVSTSAELAFDYGFLQNERDVMEMNLSRVLNHAKQTVIHLSENYTAPEKKKITVLGRGGLATLYTAINEFFLGKYMSAYDVEISRKVAYVLCGGDLTGQQLVSEQYLLDLEREAFLHLLGQQKTIDRIMYMLQNNKPLRN